MATAYSTLVDNIETVLGDSTNTVYTAAELGAFIPEYLHELSMYRPNIVKVEFEIESRYGTATSTTTSHLVDATKVQFASTDVGKVVYNATDKTWAEIIAYTSTSDVTLSKDIMASGESYYIFNAGCMSSNQINIGSVKDYNTIDSVEYPIGVKRNWSLRGNILTILLDHIPDDSSQANSDTTVAVFFNKRHKVSQLTDFAGAVNNVGGYAAGVTSMAINGLQASGTIEEGQEFTIAYTPGIYTVTSSATITTNAATISFYPGLISAVDNSAVISFTQSTITPFEELILAEWVSGKASINKAQTVYQQAQGAIALITTANTAISNTTARITQAVSDISSGRTEAEKIDDILDEANTQIDLINAQVDDAVSNISSASSLLNTIPLGGGASDYFQSASANLNSAAGYLQAGSGYLREASSRGANVTHLAQLASGELSSATSYFNQSAAYMREISSKLNIASSGKVLEQWGMNKLAYARDQMRRFQVYQNSYEYTRS